MASAGTLDDIGVTQLRAFDSTLIGTGVPVAQAEANLNGTTTPSVFEVNPAAINQPVSLFTYISSDGTATTFPNAVGTESSHADTVADIFYGRNNTTTPEGVAPGVAHVDNYDASYYFNNVVTNGTATANGARVINQSFIFTGLSASNQQLVEQRYDNYIAFRNLIVVTGAGNGGPVAPPATAYNVIAVGAYGGASSTGPTSDGRSKPDIAAPAGETSYSTPLVSGAAAILVQAGARGDAATGTASAATDSRTIKALLLNGAVKPPDWTHTPTMPLDQRYGAGVLNVFNSYQQLRAGDRPFTSTNNVQTPQNGGTAVSTTLGFDLNSITSSTIADGVNHYFFDLTTTGAPLFTLTSTLIWNRQLNQTSINNLDLFLYDAITGTLVDSSVSTVDNVEELYTRNLPVGKYDLEVVKRSGTPGATNVSNSETYALAFNFAAVPEPSTVWLLAVGSIGLIARLRHRRG